VVSKSNITETNWKNKHTETNYKLQYWSEVHSMVMSNIYFIISGHEEYKCCSKGIESTMDGKSMLLAVS
jgi:hypothetical protein